MKKILLIGNDTTSIFNFRYELICALIEHGFFVSVVCKPEQHIEELKEKGCAIIPIEIARKGKNPFQDIRLYGEYKRIIKKVAPDVVCTFNIKPNVYGGLACAGAKVPYLVNVCGLGTPVEMPGPLQWLTCRLYKLGAKKAACVFFQNEENRQFFEKRKMLSGRCRLLPGSGVNLEKWKYLPYPNEDAVDFLFVSRIMKEKGIDQYLEAAEEVKVRHPEARFHVIGACENQAYAVRLETLQSTGTIQYHGWQPDMRSFQEINCCTVHPTYYPEGISNVLLEAAACGRPIITTDRSGCREVVEDGVNGYICRQQDADDLIRQIEKFLSLPWDQRRDMGHAGRVKVEREFDRKLVVRIYLEEVKKALQH